MTETPVLENNLQEETFPRHQKAQIRIKFLIEIKQRLKKVSGVNVDHIFYKDVREEDIIGDVPPIIVKTSKPQLIPKKITIGTITTEIETEIE